MFFIENLIIQLFVSALPNEIQVLTSVLLVLLVYIVSWRVFSKAGEKFPKGNAQKAALPPENV